MKAVLLLLEGRVKGNMDVSNVFQYVVAQPAFGRSPVLLQQRFLATVQIDLQFHPEDGES